MLLSNRSILNDLRVQFREYRAFLGARTVHYISFGSAIGIALFSVELVFAYALQNFLASLGLGNLSDSTAARFLPRGTMYQVLFTITIIGVMRGFLQWIQAYFLEAASEAQKCFQRSRVLRIVFGSERSVGTDALTHFGENIGVCGLSANALELVVTRSVAALLLYFWMLAQAFWPTLYFTVAIVFMGLVLNRLDQRNGYYGKQLHDVFAGVSRRLYLGIKNYFLLKVYGTDRTEEIALLEAIKSYESSALLNARLSGFIYALPQTIGVLVLCLVVLAIRKFSSLEGPILVTFFYVLFRFVQMSSDLARSIAAVRFYRPRINALREWFAAHESSRQVAVAAVPDVKLGVLSPKNIIGFELNDISFHYKNSKNYIYKNFNLKIEPGKTTAILGRSGSGKSTLLSLLLGLEKPTQGQIDIVFKKKDHAVDSKVPLDAAMVTSLVGYVSSEPFVIEGTVLDNITYGLPFMPSDEELQAVLQKASCGFVQEFPDRLQHQISDQGFGLSAGQKQRLALARALLRKPSLLILDEATANLDAQTELEIIHALRKLKGSVTQIVITHRDSELFQPDHVVRL